MFILYAALAIFPFLIFPSIHAIKLKTFFSPLDIESLEHVKIKRSVGLSVDENLSASLKGVVDWRSAASEETEIDDRKFSVFLPPGIEWEHLRVGDSWQVFKPYSEDHVSSEPRSLRDCITIYAVEIIAHK